MTVRLTWTGERLSGCVPDGPTDGDPAIVLVHGIDATGPAGVDCGATGATCATI